MGLAYSCNENKPNPSALYNQYENEVAGGGENDSQETREAEKKPAIFYQRMLELFCQRYYHDCFNRKYFFDSLIVDSMDVICGNWEDGNIVSWNMIVKGRHSFEGTLKYNDDPFTAFVHDRGNNTYEITFEVTKHYLIGDDEKISATRTMTFYE